MQHQPIQSLFGDHRYESEFSLVAAIVLRLGKGLVLEMGSENRWRLVVVVERVLPQDEVRLKETDAPRGNLDVEFPVYGIGGDKCQLPLN
jgi:hypothetical protein